MALHQVLLVCAALGMARAGPLGPVGHEPEPFDPNPQYSYSYSIQDATTGDSKTQSETRNGDVVQGQYSVVDADGTRRIVDYTADALHGFNAVVRREGTPHGLPIVRAVARTLVPAPPPAVVQVAPTPASVVRAAPYVQYSSPRFSYSVQPVAVGSSPVAHFAPAPIHAVHAPLNVPSLGLAGSSAVHTSVSTPYHSYSY